ncbi:MAG TPA: DNA polymerase I [Solirubrobacterales bacterium]|nr:DNA polymerase I [Solirubrobacterales bacterium]
MAKADGKRDGELFLIDGNSLAYRAFFALPESIATSDGRPTNAIYGFASMMAKILIDHSPKAVIVAWDAGMSGREKVYEPYKAQRPSRPDLLREQWPHLAPLAEAFGFHNVKCEGWEADDVIATLTRQAREAGIPVMIVSGDRDVYQLVGDGVRVMTTSRGVTDTKVYDAEGVVERYGVPPELVTDLIGLKGDTSDNIPGVPGIGDKTAAQLLQRFGSLDAVLDSVDEISGAKRKQNLTEHADDAQVSKQLATLTDDVDVEIDVAAELRGTPDRSRLREVAAEFELRAVIQRLDEEWDEVVPGRAVEETIEVEAVEGSPADLPEGPIAIAISGGRWAATAGDAVVTGDAADLEALARELAGRPLIGHDLKSLGGAGGRGLITAAGGPEALDLEHDTMVAAYLIDPARRTYELQELAADAGLAAVSGSEPTRPGTEVAAAADGSSEQLSLAAEEEAARDPAVDARLSHELAARQRERLEEVGLTRLLHEVEMPLIEVLAAMERLGVKLDAARLAEIGIGMADRIAELEREIYALAGHEFTIGSPQQLGEVLFDELKLTKKRRGKTGFSTDARVLAQIRDEHEIVAKVEEWRELTKLKSTYLDPLPGYIDPGDSRIHTTFNQVTTATGRLSSTNPNLQNIPIRRDLGRPIRSCFVAEDGKRLLSVDYNQVELRVLAHVAGESVLREIFASGEDVHAETAAGIVGADPAAISPGERSQAKMVNYGIAYGLSAFGLADRLQIPREEAAVYIERYFERFPAVKRFIDETIAGAENDGYVTTLLGRRRRIPELRSGQRQRRLQGERLAVSTVVQGTAADIIKLAMVRCHRALADAGMATRLVLQIHDELLFEGPEGEIDAARELVSAEMCAAFELDPPLVVEAGVGEDWLAAK